MASDSPKLNALYVFYVVTIMALSYSCLVPDVGVVVAHQTIPQIIEKHFDNSMLILPAEFTKVEKNFMSQNFFNENSKENKFTVQTKSSFANGNLVAVNMLSGNDYTGVSDTIDNSNSEIAQTDDPSIKELKLSSFINIDSDYKLAFSEKNNFTAGGINLPGQSGGQMFIGEMPSSSYNYGNFTPTNYITLHLASTDNNENRDDFSEPSEAEILKSPDMGQLSSDPGELASAESETSLDMAGLDETIAPTSNILDKYSSNLKELNMSLFSDNQKLAVKNFDIPELNQNAEYTKTYIVTKDDNIISIAKQFNVTVSDLMAANKMTSSELKTGGSILVPDNKNDSNLSLASAENGSNNKEPGNKDLKLNVKKEKAPEINIRNLLWPCNTRRITSNFGVRVHPVYHYKKFHNGVDIGAGYGSRIKSCEAGVVVFSGWKSGYGRVVIVKHTKDIYTLYAHCSKLLVKKGQSVKRGEAIANIGQSGVSTGPHLHLGVQKSGRFVNPMNFF